MFARHYVGPPLPADVRAYDYVCSVPLSDLAWEFLRRNPHYQHAYRSIAKA